MRSSLPPPAHHKWVAVSRSTSGPYQSPRSLPCHVPTAPSPQRWRHTAAPATIAGCVHEAICSVSLSPRPGHGITTRPRTTTTMCLTHGDSSTASKASRWCCPCLQSTRILYKHGDIGYDHRPWKRPDVPPQMSMYGRQQPACKGQGRATTN